MKRMGSLLAMSWLRPAGDGFCFKDAAGDGFPTSTISETGQGSDQARPVGGSATQRSDCGAGDAPVVVRVRAFYRISCFLGCPHPKLLAIGHDRFR
jgi:hypothetical protein